MNIFITGSTGFIGKHLRKRLKRYNLYLYKRDEDVKEALKKSTPDYIIHLAGEIYREDEMFDSNIKLTEELLKYSLKIPYRSFIYVGSSSEYGRKKHPMKESDVLEPTNMYEATKGSATLLCQAYAKEHNKPISILRPFSLYGKDDSPHKFIPTIIKCLKFNQVLKISEGVHDFVHIDDFLDAIELVMTTPSIGEIYNVCTGFQTSNHELVRRFEMVSRQKINKVNTVKIRDYDSLWWTGDNTKIKKLGWYPTKSLTEGIKELI